MNFKVLTPAAFPVFKMANQPFELVVHVVFGALLSLALLTWAGAGEPFGAARAERVRAPAPGEGSLSVG